jgi:hypothetical protein
MKRFLLSALLILALGTPALAQGNQVTLGSQVNSGTIATSPGTGTVSVGAKVTDPLTLFGAYGTLTISITGGWSGTIVPEVQSCDSAGTWNTLQVYPLNSTTGQTSITANGVYQGSLVGFCAARVRGNTVATAAASVTLAATFIGGPASTNGGAGGGGGSVTQGTVPWVDNITQWASVTLGAATAWGTAPTGNVPGVNANILGPLGQQLSAASIPVVLPVAQITTLTPPTTVTANGAANVTATDCSGTVTSGGTAQNAFTAQTTLHGFTIANIDTTEPLWISFTTTAAAAGSGSYPLPAATATTYAGFGSFTAPPGFGLNHALSVIAATTSHKFTCTWW